MSSIYVREQNVTDKAHIAYTITDEGMDGFGQKNYTGCGLWHGGHSASNTVFDLSDMRHSCCY